MKKMSLNDKMQSSSYSNGRLPSLTAVHFTRRHISANRKIERSYFQVNKTMKGERKNKTNQKRTKQDRTQRNSANFVKGNLNEFRVIVEASLSLQLYYIKSETQTLLHVTQFIRTSLSMTQDKIHGLSPNREEFPILGSDLWQPCLKIYC